MALGFFLREALRSLRRNAVPSFAAMASVLVTMLVLGVFIPIVQATTGAANEVRGKRARQRLPDDRRDARTTSSACADAAEDTPHVGKVKFVSKAEAYQRGAQAQPRGLRAAGLQPAARHLPRHAGRPGQDRRAARRARAGHARRRAHRRSTRRSTRSRTAATRRTKILSATRVVKLSMALLARAAGRGLGPADLQHDPPVAVRPPPRGRGDEARRRDRLVHPLAVRDRGHHRRRAGRR